MTTFRPRYLFVIGTFLFLAFAIPSQAQKDKKRKQPGTTSTGIRLAEAEAYFAEGEKYFILEDYAKSLEYFQRSLELNAGGGNGEIAAIHYKIAEILSKGSKQDDLLKASISIENAIALEKKNKYYYVLASTIYSALNNFPLAENALQTLIQEIPGSQEYYYDLAALYIYDHKPEEAIRAYNKAEAALGISDVSSSEKERLYFEQGKITEAIAEGQKLIDANPDDERYVLGFAETLARYKQQAKAIAVIEKFLADHPENGTAKLLLAAIYHDAGQAEKSGKLMLDVFDSPDVPVAEKVSMLSNEVVAMSRQNLATTSSAGETEAEKLFAKLVSTNPKDATVHAVGGDLFMVLKKNERAEAEYLAAIHNGSTNFDAFQNLISLELQDNKFDSIIVHSEMGLELFPNQAVLYSFNGYAQLRTKHFRDAVASLEQAKRLTAGNASSLGDINGMLGDAYNGLKDYAKSDKAYEDALLLDPENALILNNYSYYLAVRKENLDKAEKMGAQLIKSNPNNASYLDTYSWVLYMRGKYKEAKKVMEKAVGNGQPTAVMLEHYGDILFQLGETDAAVKEWQRSKSLDSTNTALDKKIVNRKL